MKKTDIIRNQNPKNVLPGESYPGMEGDRTQGPGNSQHAPWHREVRGCL